MTRKWFQIHLPTAIVLLFVAGGLISMNIGESVAVVGFSREPDFPYVATATVQGWPCYDSVNKIRGTQENGMGVKNPVPAMKFRADRSPTTAIVLNLCFAGITLICTALFMEYLIRGREIEKP
jgi:hypothetical protein